MKIQPVILAGGWGARLWPLSRRPKPKQFLSFPGEDFSFFQKAVLRCDNSRFSDPVIMGSINHSRLITDQLRKISANGSTVLLEPFVKNTAASVTVAAYHAWKNDIGYILIMPSDHQIQNTGAFINDIGKAYDLSCDAKNIVLLGKRAEYPCRNYGYILKHPANTARIENFIEKPESAAAKILMRSGRAFWNTGIFLIPVATYLTALENNNPAFLAHCRKSLDDAVSRDNGIALDSSSYACLPAISFDKFFLEKTPEISMLPCSFQWHDIGTWKGFGRLLFSVKRSPAISRAAS